MQKALFAHLIALLVAATAVAQQSDPVARLKEGLGPPRPEPVRVEPIRDETMAKLLGAFRQADRNSLPKPLIPQIRGLLAETYAAGLSFDSVPQNPWGKDQRFFQVASVMVESAPVEPGFVLLRVSGTLAATDAQQLVPVLLQFSKDKSRLVIGKGKAAAEAKLFEIVNERMRGADHAVIGFVNERDGSWAMYRDATSGKPLDQFATVKIDEKTLIDLESKQSAERPADTSAKKLAADNAAAKAAAEEKIADADAVAQQAAMKEHYKRMALSTAPFRKWNILGGSKASEAKITGYENGTVTLQKRSGKSVQVRAARLNKEDREYLDTWIEKARVDK